MPVMMRHSTPHDDGQLGFLTQTLSRLFGRVGCQRQTHRQQSELGACTPAPMRR
jgi:hypothetical protein